MQIRALVWRSVWSTLLFGSLLAACGDEGSVNPEGSESAKAKLVFEAFTPNANADNAGQAPDRELHSAHLSCPGFSARVEQWQPAWNSNHNTAGDYYCNVSFPTTSHGTYVVAYTSSPGRSGGYELICDDGEWVDLGGACNGSLVPTANSSVCSDSDPVRNMWIGWYLADYKRCADSGGLNWWVSSYNNNAICFPSNNYDGHGSKDACWRAHFRASANLTYYTAQYIGHIAPSDEESTCQSGAAYPWANVSTYGEYCKSKPDQPTN